MAVEQVDAAGEVRAMGRWTRALAADPCFRQTLGEGMSRALSRWIRASGGLVAMVSIASLSPVSIGHADANAARKIATRGVPVSVELTPGCRLSADDVSARERADVFVADLEQAMGKVMADIAFPQGFGEWAATLEMVSQSLPPASHARELRIIKSIPNLDLRLMRSMYQPFISPLPNFRAACTFTVGVREWREE